MLIRMSENSRSPSSRETAEVVAQVLDEMARTPPPIRLPPAQSPGVRWWHLLTALLAAMLAAGGVIGTLGRAFYVERGEYSTDQKTNAVDHTAIQQTLSDVRRTLEEQTRAINDMSKAVNAQAVEMATMRGRK